MKRSKEPLHVYDLEITDLTTEGKAVARNEGLVVFVEAAVPGDRVNARIYRSKKNYAEASLSRIIQPSKWRVNAVCEHFGTCGGCKWQNLSYVQQLLYKQKYVTDALQRIGKLELPEVSPIIGSDQFYYYRNKLEFSFSDKRWLNESEMLAAGELSDRRGLGFHIPGMFDKVLDIKNCYLQPAPSNDIRNFVKEYAFKNNLSFFNIRTQKGFLRTLMIRNTLRGDLMVFVSVFEWLERELQGLLEALVKNFPGITSLVYAHNAKGNDSMTGLEIKTFYGNGYIEEQMEDLVFRISPTSFFQTNSTQALKLYEITREFASLSGNENVYDLYTGTGTIANFVARSSKHVLGLEYVPESITDARLNSSLNGITNTSFLSGDLKDLLTDKLVSEYGSPDVVITDPPRAGMHEEVVRNIVAAHPQRIVYVSCNPGTQARDLSMMDADYRIEKVQPVDMFPQTAHVENVVLLERRR